MIASLERYYRLSSYYKNIFGLDRVQKLNIDAGFNCPNRDGRISERGCFYCDNRGFSLNTRFALRPLEAQIEEGMRNLKRKFGADRFVIYFQAHTNTYAPLEVLKERFDKIKKFKDVVGISIATRPDCVDDGILDLIHSYSSEYEVWIEYGLQSANDSTLKAINRGHSYRDFLNAVALTRKRKNIKICAHLIIGLPGEDREMILRTARLIGALRLDGVKIHPLHVIKGTLLEELFSQGLYRTLELEEYADLATDFLEYLWPQTVIQRISADCPDKFLAGPKWIANKNQVLQTIEEKLLSENKFQGRLYKEEPSLLADLTYVNSFRKRCFDYPSF